MGATRVRFDLGTYVGVFAALLVGAAAYGLVRQASSALTWVAVGIVLALALNPLVERIQGRLGCRRAVAVGLCGLGLVSLLSAVVALLGPTAIDQARSFRDDIPETVRDFYDFPIIGDRLERADAADKVVEWVDELPSRVDDDAVSGVVDDLVGGASAAVAVALVTIAVLLDGERLVALIGSLVPDDHRPARTTSAGSCTRRSGGTSADRSPSPR